MTQLPQSYLVFLGEVIDPVFAKTAFGVRDWAADRCIGELALPGCKVTLGLPKLSPAEAKARGVQALLIGVAPIGGAVGARWIPVLCEALEAGLDLVSGMHSRLGDTPELAEAAARCGRRLFDVREPPAGIPIGTGRKRSGKRLLTVGTDCALGKKYTALALTREFRRRGINSDYRATGQTGILIAGSGIPIDAVVSDFVAGAAEILSPPAADDHWDVIEGQGSLFHPSYAAVSLGLLHGSQPDVVVMCHSVARKHMLGLPEVPVPSLPELLDLTLTLARRTNPAVRCAGIALNTSDLTAERARSVLAEHTQTFKMPTADPIRGGAEFDALVSACLE